MTNCSVRVATPEDIHEWFQGPPPVSLRALVMGVEGKLEGLCGVQAINGEITCFSIMSAECRKHKKGIVTGIRLLRKMLEEYQYVIAYATKDEPTADAFIRHVGFRLVGSFNEERVYLWERRQYQ